jgi:hypothetical protein
MSQFDSHKWTRQYKEALYEKKNEEKDEYKGYKPDPSDDNIKKKGQSVHSKDLLHTTKVDGKKADKVGMKDKDGLDVYASGLKEDYSTMRLKSNIAQKWRDKADMENDLLAWYQSSLAAGGEDVGQDLLGVMKEVVFQMEKLLKNRL